MEVLLAQLEFVLHVLDVLQLLLEHEDVVLDFALFGLDLAEFDADVVQGAFGFFHAVDGCFLDGVFDSRVVVGVVVFEVGAWLVAAYCLSH